MTFSTVFAPVDGRSTARIVRFFALFVTVGYLAYLLITITPTTGSAPHAPGWWNVLAIVAVFGTGILPGALSFSASLEHVRRASGVAALVYLLALGSWFLVWDHEVTSSTDSMWLTAFPGVASMMAVIAWRVPFVFVHLAVACTLSQICNILVRGTSWALFPAEVVLSFVFCTMYVGAAAIALRTGRILDETKDATYQAAASAAAQEARGVERERFDALVHDRVLSTLLVASRTGNTPDVAGLAKVTLAELDELRDGTAQERPFTTKETLVHLRTATVAVDDRAVFQGHVVEPDPELLIPPEVTRTLGQVLVESLRNSRIHAGPTATRTVEVDVAESGVAVAVVDDGRGFDVAEIQPHRLGIAVSIVGRMRRLEGGRVEIDSRPGSGTRVEFGWTR